MVVRGAPLDMLANCPRGMTVWLNTVPFSLSISRLRVRETGPMGGSPRVITDTSNVVADEVDAVISADGSDGDRADPARVRPIRGTKKSSC